MPFAQNLATTSLTLSIGVAAIAAILGLRQWSERRTRGADLSISDRKHFFWQDLRRWVGIASMLALAIGVFAGSRLEPRIPLTRHELEVYTAARIVAGSGSEPLVAGRANPLFVGVWLGVMILIPVLVTLAWFDWRATRRYAQRHWRLLARERIEIIDDN